MPDNEINISDFFKILFKNKLLFILFFIISVISIISLDDLKPKEVNFPRDIFVIFELDPKLYQYQNSILSENNEIKHIIPFTQNDLHILLKSKILSMLSLEEFRLENQLAKKVFNFKKVNQSFSFNEFNFSIHSTTKEHKDNVINYLDFIKTKLGVQSLNSLKHHFIIKQNEFINMIDINLKDYESNFNNKFNNIFNEIIAQIDSRQIELEEKKANFFNKINYYINEINIISKRFQNRQEKELDLIKDQSLEDFKYSESYQNILLTKTIEINRIKNNIINLNKIYKNLMKEIEDGNIKNKIEDIKMLIKKKSVILIEMGMDPVTTYSSELEKDLYSLINMYDSIEKFNILFIELQNEDKVLSLKEFKRSINLILPYESNLMQYETNLMQDINSLIQIDLILKMLHKIKNSSIILDQYYDSLPTIEFNDEIKKLTLNVLTPIRQLNKYYLYKTSKEESEKTLKVRFEEIMNNLHLSSFLEKDSMYDFKIYEVLATDNKITDNSLLNNLKFIIPIFCFILFIITCILKEYFYIIYKKEKL